MKMKTIIILVLFLLIFSCSKDNDIEYQEGYPSLLADNWVAFEFQGGDIEGNILEPYEMVTALDPNRENYLIIDKIYNSDLRVRAAFADTAFSVVIGDQLEPIGTNNYGIEYISIDGYVTENPVLTSFMYDLASAYYENMALYPEDIKDIIFLRAGFYDIRKAIVDTVLILGYRKTGFENVEY